MKRDKFNLVLFLLCSCTGSLSNPVPEKANKIEIHTYKGHIDTTTSVSDESLARWTISANLHRMFQHADPDYIIVKLDNIKTSLFNGNRSNLHHAHEKSIPEEAKILEQPFALKWDPDPEGSRRFSLLLKPNEPLWSVNMKRGVANLIEFDYEKPEVTSDGEIAPLKFPVYNSEENLIYGKCEVVYTRKSASVQDGLVYEKKMDSLNCKQQAVQHLTNTARAPGIKNLFDILDYNQNKILTLKKRDGFYGVEKMELKSSISYKSTRSADYTHQVDQEYSLTYQDLHEFENLIDVSEFTDKREFTYEFGDDPTAGRHVDDKDSAKLTKQFLQQYEEFNQLFKFSPVELNVHSSHLVYDMYNTLLDIDYDGFKSMEKVIGDNEDIDYGYYYLSMLPYVGTNASVEYLTKFYKSDKIRANEGFSARMLVSFPQFVQKPSDDKLIEMEGLMNNPHAQKKITKHAAVFGFASAVGTACRKDAISKKYKQKYIDMFHNKYLDGESYEEKMVYLLGLVNMGECLDFDFMNSITTNSSELVDLRSFALHGFKKYLQNYKNTDKVYELYWPIVQKKLEPFEIRVAALELLLSSPLSEDQFNTIVQNYSEDLNEPEDKHLANYLLTSLHSIQNTTGYYDPLGALASEAIKNANIHRIPRTWATGKYRLSHTDAAPNFGAAFEARLISDINTNLFNNLEISFNCFGNNFDFGTYTLYLKFKGFYDKLFYLKYLRYTEVSLPQLLKLLKDNDFNVKSFSPEGHVDIVLFSNNVAIYATHWDTFEGDNVLDLINELDEFLLNSKHFTMPVDDYVHIPSDIGTPIIISNYMIDVSKQKRGGPDDNSLRYRSLWSFHTWVEAYNPLADAHIATYKYFNEEKSLKLNVTFTKKFPPSLTWMNEKDSYTQIWDNNMGVTVEEENILKEYCETCETSNEVDINKNYSPWTNSGLKTFGVRFNVESYKHSVNSHSGNVFEELWTKNLHRYNTDALPYAGPFLMMGNILNHKFWLQSDLSKGLISSFSSNGFSKTSETTWNTLHDGHTSNAFTARSLMNIKSDVTVKNGDEILSFINLTVAHDWDPDYVAENTTKQTGRKILFFSFDYHNQKKLNESYRICGRGVTNFPSLRDDRLSINPYEETISETVFQYTTNIFDDSEDPDECTLPEFTYTMKEIYSSTDKKSNMSNKLSKDYKQCIADSKDMKYTVPTKECKLVSNKLTEYDNYQVYWTAVEHFEDRNVTIQEKTPIFEYSRIAEDKLRVDISALSNLVKIGEQDKFSFEFYYPQMTVNPLWLSYNTDESVHPQYARSTCTITPSTIEKFSGKYVPNQRKEWLAFGGCVNSSRTALNGHTIDDKHVGFTFYVDEAVAVVTVKNGHLDVTVNGKQITEFYQN